jgi:hypothetical protein
MMPARSESVFASLSQNGKKLASLKTRCGEGIIIIV